MNKKFAIALAAAAAFVPSMSGQSVVLWEDFEAEAFPPAGWITLDADADGTGWERFSGPASQITQVSGSKACAISKGKTIPEYTNLPAQDNWLITPALVIPNDKCVLSLRYGAQDLDSTEKMQILVSEGSAETADFTAIYTETVDNGYDDDVTIQSLEKALSAYSGKTIRIAIRHTSNAYGSYALSADNILVYNKKGANKPTGFTATAAEGGRMAVNLKWTNPSSCNDGSALTDLTINVYRDGQKIVALPATPGQEQTYTDEAMSMGTHKYTISAENAEGETQTLTAKSLYIGPDTPAAIANPVAMALDCKILLTWTAPAKGANNGYIDIANLKYKITRKVGDAVTVVAEAHPSTTFTDENPVVGQSNVYEIQAVNEAGESTVKDWTAAIVTPATNGYGDFGVGITSEKNNSLQRLPVDVSSKYSVSQSIYYPADFKFAKGEIASLIYKSYRGTDTDAAFPVRIYMHETAAADLSAGWDKNFTEANKVFEGTMTFSQGPRDVAVELDTPFDYQGGNLVVTFIKDGTPNGAYSDRFYSVTTTDGKIRSYTGSTYDPVNVASLPTFSSYSEKKVAELPSTRFYLKAEGVAAVSGTVTNSATGAAVAGATVKANGYDLEAHTDAEGAYFIPYVPVDVATFTVSRAGFATANVDVALQSGVAATVNAQLVEDENYTLSGKLIAGDTRLPAEGAVVAVNGYDSLTTVAGADGSFTLSPVYAAKDYTLTVLYPLYEMDSREVCLTADDDLGTLTLERAPITPFNVDAQVADDGSAVALTWSAPADRDVLTGWNTMAENLVQKEYSGERYYSPDDFNVAHQFSAQVLADRKLIGTSVSSMRIWLKATQGTFTAKVWEGNRNTHTEVYAQAVPLSEISADGGWVEIAFDEPVEIRADRDYLIGMHFLNASEYPVGTASPYTGAVNGVKWDDLGQYSPNAYACWLIEADFTVPGTKAPLADATGIPACEYNVYRRAAGDEWVKVNAAPVKDTAFDDPSWASIPSAQYEYGVTALYHDKESAQAKSMPLGRNFDYDAGVTAFISPVKSEEMQPTVTVTVTVTNFGEKPIENCPVAVKINDSEPLTGAVDGTLNHGQSAEVSFENVEVGEGLHNILAYTTLANDEVPSNDACDMLLSNLENIELHGYRWNAYGNAGFMSIHSNNPEGATFLTEVTPNDALLTAGEYVNGVIYGFTATWYGAAREFVTIRHGVWSVESSLSSGTDYVMDMAYNYVDNTMYALTPDGEDMRLATVDLTNGLVFPVATLSEHIMAIACDTEGTLYGVASDGTLYTIAPATGTLTSVAHTGITGDVKYLQSMGYDHNSQRLFWVHQGSHSDGTLQEIDPATGAATRLGDVMFNASEPSEIVALHTTYTPSGIDAAKVADISDGFAIENLGNGTLRVTAPAAGRLEIFDTNGTAAMRRHISAGTSTVATGLTSGIYLVRLTPVTGAPIATKLLVK